MPSAVLNIHKRYFHSKKFDSYLFADNTNMLFADKNFKPLETTVNRELKLFCQWLDANKISSECKKKFHQKKFNYHITLMVPDSCTNGYTPLECKDYV